MSQEENTQEIINFEELILTEQTPEQKDLNEVYIKIYKELGVFDKYKTKSE